MFITANVISIVAQPVAQAAHRITKLIRPVEEVRTIRKTVYETIRPHKDPITMLGVESDGILPHALSSHRLQEFKQTLIRGMQYELMIVLTDGEHHHEMKLNLAHIAEQVTHGINHALGAHPGFVTDEYDDEDSAKKICVLTHERKLKALPEARCVVIDIYAA